jgi:ATP-dependent Clp protease ATP-binding subunit ClpA
MGMAFTQQLLNVQQVANELAARHQQIIGPPHMLAAILSVRESGGYRLLDQLTRVAQLDSDIQSLIGQQLRIQYPKEYQYPPKFKLPLTRHAKDAMEAANETVMQRDMRWTTIDIIAGIVRAANSDSAAILAEHGLDAQSLEQYLTTGGPYLET